MMTSSPPGSMPTASGAWFFFAQPSEDAVRLDDMHAALSRLCRYGGHVPVTVLEHLRLCLALAHLGEYPSDVCAYVAAHDLHEAYCMDLPRPIKAAWPEYAILEEGWARVVHSHVGLAWPVPAEIQQQVDLIDRRAVLVELTTTGHPMRQDPRWLEAHGGPPTTLELVAAVSARLDPTPWTSLLEALHGR